MKRRVVITGIGTINSIAHNVNDTWDGLLAGKTGIDIIKKFDASAYTSQVAGEIKDFDPTEYMEKRDAKKLDMFSIYALVATKEAMKDAGLEEGSYTPERSGCVLGSGIGGMLTFEEEARKIVEKGPRRISPMFIPKMICNAAPAQVAIANNLKGINLNCVTACASANHAMGVSLRSIQYGDADIVVTGGTEASVTPLSLAGFCSMKALSTRNDDPKTACRPFDKERDGFIMAEGSGILVFEELEHALARGAKIYCEVVGFGASCDAYHITAPEITGKGSIAAMKDAIKDAGISPNEVDFMSAHGTSTPYNDKIETAAIKTVFGEYSKELAINSTKSMSGHMLGGAAALEAIVCAKTIETGKIHPTINQINPDPECDLNYVPEKMIEKQVNVALSNSLGFGGHNGVVIFKKY